MILGGPSHPVVRRLQIAPSSFMDCSHFAALNLCKPSPLFPKKPFSPLVRMLIVLQIEERILWMKYVVTRSAQCIRVCRWSKLVYMDMGKRRGSSPIFTRSAPQHGGEPQLFRQFVCATNSDTLSEMPNTRAFCKSPEKLRWRLCLE